MGSRGSRARSPRLGMGSVLEPTGPARRAPHHLPFSDLDPSDRRRRSPGEDCLPSRLIRRGKPVRRDGVDGNAPRCARQRAPSPSTPPSPIAATSPRMRPAGPGKSRARRPCSPCAPPARGSSWHDERTKGRFDVRRERSLSVRPLATYGVVASLARVAYDLPHALDVGARVGGALRMGRFGERAGGASRSRADARWFLRARDSRGARRIRS